MGKKVNLSNRTHLKTSFSFLYVFSHIRYVFDIVKKHYQQGLNMKCTMLTLFFFFFHIFSYPSHFAGHCEEYREGYETIFKQIVLMVL